MIQRIIRKSVAILTRHLRREIEHNKMLTARLLTEQNRTKNISSLHDAEFKVFSQWGDDGIIQYLVEKIDFPHQTFIEFGVESYVEANTRYLLMNNNWSGLIIDGAPENIAAVKSDEIYWKYDLQAVSAFVTAENINGLIGAAGFEREAGILHIDIDGNDYWVWKAIDVISPVVVIMEYNSVFGGELPVTVPYQPDFYRTKAHYSNLYFGASLQALCDLAEEKGYDFIGSNSHGNNAYFVRKDKNPGFKPLTCQEGYVVSKFKESRDQSGALTYLRAGERLAALKGLEVLNTRTKQMQSL